MGLPGIDLKGIEKGIAENTDKVLKEFAEQMSKIKNGYISYFVLLF